MKRLLSLKEDPVVNGLYSISQRLGAESFLVGGLLRDILLSLPTGQDYDLVFGSKTLSNKRYIAEIAEEIAHAFHGSPFPLDIDNSVYRVVIKTPSNLSPSIGSKQIRPTPIFIDLSPLRGGEIEEDLSLRDYTMNAIALDLNRLFTEDNIEVIDPLGGQEDIQKGVIRSCSEGVFAKDPVRLLRGVRFSATCGLKIEKKTRGYIKRYAYMLNDASGERIREELSTILDIEKAYPYIEDLSILGLLKEVLPYPDCYSDEGFSKTFPTLREGEIIISSISDIVPLFTSEITEYLQENTGGINKAALLKLSALIYDIGGSFSDKDRRTVIEKMIVTTGNRLKLSKKARHLLETTTKELPTALYLLTDSRLTDFDIYLFFKGKKQDEIAPLLLALSNIRAQRTVAHGTKATNIEKANSRIETILRYLFEVFYKFSSSPLLTGAEIMEAFDIRQGKIIGDIIGMLEEARAKGTIKDKKGAIKYAKGLFHSL